MEGRPNSDLTVELRWYLEEFLDYPFPPRTEQAERVRTALQGWGRAAFAALFGGGHGRDWYVEAARGELNKVVLEVSSDDPRVLAWPWEALYDEERGHVVHQCRLGRRLNRQSDPLPLSEDLPQDRLNILLVTARPYGRDVPYRSISRPLVELLKAQKLPARVHLLRPPTLERLRAHLHQKPNHYHLLHFDGHGGYGSVPEADRHRLRGLQGHLVFEDEKGEADPVPAETLSTLLGEHRLPAVVLNACQSAMLDGRAEDAFASVASAMIRSGVRGVVAMAYSLYVSGGEQFLPAFYGRLLETGSLGEAARAGRQKMLEKPERVCARGRFPLDDWLVPVLYEQGELDLSFATEGRAEADEDAEVRRMIPEEARGVAGPYGFIGRDQALLALERAMRRKPAGVAIHGLGGVGKTTLVRGFVQWLEETGGLDGGCFWFQFQDIRSANYVLNRLGESLFGPVFATRATEEKLEVLGKALSERPFVIVWDNFESASGMEGAGLPAALGPDDRAVLKRLLEALRGGRTKVLITSRSSADWLGETNRFKLPLGGLQGEERWQYCEAVLDDLGLAVNRDDEKLAELMETLRGHPLAMHVVLPLLAERSPSAVAEALQQNVEALGLTDDAFEGKLLATLRFVEDGLPNELRPLLHPLGLHERFVQLGVLRAMTDLIEGDWPREWIERFATTLTTAGLLQPRGQEVYEIHPVLTGYLRSVESRGAGKIQVDEWARVFVEVMAAVADQVRLSSLPEQRAGHGILGASFVAALRQAERLEIPHALLALLQCQGILAQNTRDFALAEQCFRRVTDLSAAYGAQTVEADAYHQLGVVAHKQRDFTWAEHAYRTALAISERLSDEQGIASSYHQLGLVAQAQRDFVQAEEWYHQALQIVQRLGGEDGAATIYHQLGRVAELRGAFGQAAEWYHKSVELKERLGDEYSAAKTYHQLGVIALEQGDLGEAERSYRKSLEITERFADEYSAATTCHQLGNAGMLRGHFEKAKHWYGRALEIRERLRDDHGAAQTYHQLGIVAQAQRDFTQSEQWFRKALQAFVHLGDENSASKTDHQLGITVLQQGDFVQAEMWFRESLMITERLGDDLGTALNVLNLGMVAHERSDFVQAESCYRKSLEIGDRLGDEHGTAVIHGQLGLLMFDQDAWLEAAAWLVKAVLIFHRTQDHDAVQLWTGNFLMLLEQAPTELQDDLHFMWTDAGLPPLLKEE